MKQFLSRLFSANASASVASVSASTVQERFFNFGQYIHHLIDLGIASPTRRALADSKRREAQRIRQHVQTRWQTLAPCVLQHDPQAIQEFDLLVDECLQNLRRFVDTQASPSHQIYQKLDALFYKQQNEYIDDENCLPIERKRIVEHLHYFNQVVGSYDRFLRKLLPLLEHAEKTRRFLQENGHPHIETAPHVFDLAAGYAGFARHLKNTLGEQIQVTASDICVAFLDDAAHQAKQDKIEMSFVEQNALNLDNLLDLPEDKRVDLFVCTQSMHHFPAGALCRMVGQAAQAARTGILFIDGERSGATLSALVPFMAVASRHYPTVHDTAVSLRRMFAEEELLLLALLAPGMPADAVVESSFLHPGFIALSALRPHSNRR